MGNFIAILSAVFMIWFIHTEYRAGHGYTIEQRASFDALFADQDHTTNGVLKHLSVADIGLDAQVVMDGAR